MSWHVFLQEGTDAVIYETGLGGEFDATNLVDRPLVAGISSLGIDHVFALGNTIDQIAWHKGGIMKTGSPAFTVEQVPEARAVLTQRAKDKGVDLTVLPIDHRLSAVHVRPDAEFQKKNASLAVALAETALTKLGVIDAVADTSSSSLPREFVDGIQDAVLRGRCEVKDEGKVRWHLDGAHTIDSLNVAARWFGQETTGR
jgi:folylpolyglutamate synthase